MAQQQQQQPMNAQQIQQGLQMVQEQLVTIAGKIETMEGNGANTIRLEMKTSYEQLKAMIDDIELNQPADSGAGRSHQRRLNGKAQLPRIFSGKKSEFRGWLRGINAFCNNAFGGFRKVSDQTGQRIICRRARAPTSG